MKMSTSVYTDKDKLNGSVEETASKKQETLFDKHVKRREQMTDI
jgi:hypothetical protein